MKVHPGVEAEPLNLQELAFGAEGVALGGEKGDDSIKAAGIAVLRQVAGGLGLFYSAGQGRLPARQEVLQGQGCLDLGEGPQGALGIGLQGCAQV